MKAALLDSFLAVYTRYGLVWYGPLDPKDIAYRLAMRLAGQLNTVVVAPDELAPVHRRQAAFEAANHAADQMIRLSHTHSPYMAWETVYVESCKEYLSCAPA